jgi:hypothetical protein
MQLKYMISNNIKGSALLIIGVILVGAGVFNFIGDTLGGDGGIGAQQCEIIASTTVNIGNQTSIEIVAAASDNAYVLLTQPVNATNTVYIGYGQDASTRNSTRLSAGNGSTSTPDSIAFGLNTDFPYVGSIEALTSVGSATIGVTVCRY